MIHKTTVPNPPPAWLVVHKHCGRDRVIGAFTSPSDPGLLAMFNENVDSSLPLRVVRDHPSLEVYHSGMVISNASWLTARDNWFERYERDLDGHLRDPRVSQVYTFA